MKGVVFTEFLQLVEDKFGYATVDKIIQESDLANDGAYTAVGTYEHGELLRLIANLSRETDLSASELVTSFGNFLFGRLAESYPQLLEHTSTSLQMLTNLHNYIHVEVRKLYADAELPDFEHQLIEPNRLELTYRSSRPFADLAEGLIVACIDYFGESAEVERKDLGEGNQAALFLITYANGFPVS